MARLAWSVGLTRGSATGIATCALALGAGLGCGDDTIGPAPSNDAGGGTDATVTDAGGGADGSSADSGSTLYLRLGGHAGIRSAVNAIVAAELQNQDIASYFFFQSGAPGNGHPTADQIEECFTDLVGSAAMGPEMYPTTITTDAGAYTCRSMQAIHAPLLISGGTFDTFVMIAGSTLASAGVSSDDVTTLASVLNSTKSDIVTTSLADAGLEPYPANDAGTTTDSGAATDAGADAATTLYERLGGHSGIRSAVNAIVAAELTNQDIASYFFFQSGAPGNGHPTPDQIEECFTDLVGSAAMGPETYPTTITTDAGAYTCRSMQAIHQPLLISGGTFDTFVMIAGSTLTSAGVSSDDVTTLASVLNSTKTDIVTSSLADAGLQSYPGTDAGDQ
jgi:hypothetical protein